MTWSSGVQGDPHVEHRTSSNIVCQQGNVNLRFQYPVGNDHQVKVPGDFTSPSVPQVHGATEQASFVIAAEHRQSLNLSIPFPSEHRIQREQRLSSLQVQSTMVTGVTFD